ncbi:uncharacterized protein N7487_008744 [Penicillium crustosum]|uniref:uncharacterized protein n=1 Tax=Penicillium crustosum TaxID=36656 RepID=UPI00239A0BDA|nr:uncharacterized protein N7487_008744 [Penicillium crustosum]KAJ5402848.1 hypothetical protein N7487_008744 [Penicillium crustosum]
MKLTTFITALSFSTLVAATPVPLSNRGNLLPTPMQAVEKLFPGSGIPRLAGKIEKAFDIWMSNA